MRDGAQPYSTAGTIPSFNTSYTVGGAFTTVDVDHDGFPEVVVASPGIPGTVTVYESNGSQISSFTTEFAPDSAIAAVSTGGVARIAIASGSGMEKKRRPAVPV